MGVDIGMALFHRAPICPSGRKPGCRCRSPVQARHACTEESVSWLRKVGYLYWKVRFEAIDVLGLCLALEPRGGKPTPSSRSHLAFTRLPFALLHFPSAHSLPVRTVSVWTVLGRKRSDLQYCALHPEQSRTEQRPTPLLLADPRRAPVSTDPVKAIPTAQCSTDWTVPSVHTFNITSLHVVTATLPVSLLTAAPSAAQHPNVRYRCTYLRPSLSTSSTVQSHY